jgi:hypothetical protein
VPLQVKQLLLHASHLDVLLLLIKVGEGQVYSHLLSNKNLPVTHDRHVVAVMLQAAHGDRHTSHCLFN